MFNLKISPLRWLAAFAFASSISVTQAQAPANDAFANAAILSGTTNVVTGSNVGASAESSEPSHAGNVPSASVWWTWIAPDSGTAVVQTLGSAFDTVLAVYTGDAVNALALVAANDDEAGLGTSLLTFPAVQGTAYHIAVDGYQGANGSVRLGVRLPVVPSAPAITTQPISQTVPADAGTNLTLTVSVTGSFPRIFEWQKNGERLPGGASASYTIPNAQLGDAGDYRVIVTNYFGSVTSVVAVVSVRAGVDHDDFAGRATLVGMTNSASAHNVGATLEADEPTHANAPIGASLWWTWTAPQNGLTRIDTMGSIDTHGLEMDTALAVYLGSSLNGLTPVVANNDERTDVIPTSKVFFRAVAGVTYQIAVAGVKSAAGDVAMGDVVLNVAQSPDNDFFVNALGFPENASVVHDDNSHATIESGEPAHAGNPGGKSVWWTWLAPADGAYVLDTVGSAVDTVLAIYTGASLNALNLVGEDDNRSDDGASIVRFMAQGGTRYHFAIDGFAGSSGVSEGAIVLNLNPTLELNDDFADRSSISGTKIHVAGSNVGASKESGEPLHGGNAGGRSVWWTWTARADGPVGITTRGSSFDTALAVYTGSQLASLALVAENDDANPLDPAAGSAVKFMAVNGQTYQIAVDGYRSEGDTTAEGEISLTLLQVVAGELGGNDLFANRYVISGQTNIVVGVNTNATVEAGEPDHAGNDGGRSVWWTWTAPASGPVRVDTIGSRFDTVLGIYTGAEVGALTLVQGDDNSGGKGRSVATFIAMEGVEYQIAVDGFNDGSGAESGGIVLSLRQYNPGSLHANDDFENAPPISEPFLTVAGLNIGASREAGEPNHGTSPQGHSVWWSWTATRDGAVTISTDGSEFDTILAIYTGNSFASLVLVAENDDVNHFDLQSTVTFQALAETTYRIAVDGFGGAIGRILLTVAPDETSGESPVIRLSPTDLTRFAGGAGGGADVTFRAIATGAQPMSYQWFANGAMVEGATNDVLTLTNATAENAGAYHMTAQNSFGTATSSDAQFNFIASPFNDDFASRILIVGSSNVIQGSILGATKEAGERRHGAEAGGRSVWWRWVAPANGLIEVHTVGSSFDTLLAVYQGDAANALTLIAENNNALDEVASFSRVVFNAIAGQEYQIAVDGQKLTSLDGNVSLTLRQPPEIPEIAVQPTSPGVVNGDSAFALSVTTVEEAALFSYQWLLNGEPIAKATNATYRVEHAFRAHVGEYAVRVASESGSVLSSNVTVAVLVPQKIVSQSVLPDGSVRMAFADFNGTIPASSSQFEVQFSTDLSGPAPSWTAASGTIVAAGGQWVFEDHSASGSPARFYRVVER
jgi:hypothetical protein